MYSIFQGGAMSYCDIRKKKPCKVLKNYFSACIINIFEEDKVYKLGDQQHMQL